jgi:hypothetical protein
MIIMALAFAAAGGIVNIAVAWGCSATRLDARAPLARSPYTEADRNRFEQLRLSLIQPEQWIIVVAHPGYLARTATVRMPESYAQAFAGLPLFSMTGEKLSRELRSGTYERNTMWQPKQLHKIRGEPIYVVLPLVPIWPGFAINTIFYAAILWLMFITPGKIRHFIRIRRGLCPSCAYPVGTSPVCTECGERLVNR